MGRRQSPHLQFFSNLLPSLHQSPEHHSPLLHPAHLRLLLRLLRPHLPLYPHRHLPSFHFHLQYQIHRFRRHHPHPQHQQHHLLHHFRLLPPYHPLHPELRSPQYSQPTHHLQQRSSLQQWAPSKPVHLQSKSTYIVQKNATNAQRNACY